MASSTAQTIAYPAPSARPYRRGAEVTAPHVVVLFGGTGDLSRRKLIPGLARLASSHLAPEMVVVASSLDEMSDDDFRAFAKAAVDDFGKHVPVGDEWEAFASHLRYVPTSAGPEALAAAVTAAEEQLGEDVRRLHYLSVPPAAALDVIGMLDRAGLVDRSRVIMEKPFGTDLESAVELNRQVHEVFDETDVFRIDHFLGKEAAQNVLALRFANGLFEPIWNRNFIDHIQIDVPETLGLDQRADFYESTGAYKDMVVTHLFQVMAFVAMEPPTALDPASISEEKNKVFRALLPIAPSDVVRGQFSGYATFAGWPGIPTRRPSSHCAAASTTGVGPASRSTCARVSRWPRGSGSSRSPSRRPPARCSRRTPASAPPAPITSPSTSPTTPGYRCPTTASGRGRE